MNKYFACILFESFVADECNVAPLCEESIRLIIAQDENAARIKAEMVGRASEHSYLNEEGARVEWRIVSVFDIQEFCEDEIAAGVEVYSRFFRDGRDGKGDAAH